MIERRRTSLICVHDNKVLGFHAEDPTTKTGYFFLPGGKIEEGESPEAATLRETMEETGYEAIIVPGFRVDSEYPFRWDGQDYLSKTVFLVGRLKNPGAAPAVVVDANYHRGVDWISVEDVAQVFSYHPKIQAAIEQGILFLSQQK